MPVADLVDVKAEIWEPGRAIRVRQAYDDGTVDQLPPIRIGSDPWGARVINDGNHRLSVARERRAPTILVAFEDRRAMRKAYPKLPPSEIRRIRELHPYNPLAPVRNPLDIDPPPGGVRRLLEVGADDVGEPRTATATWKDAGVRRSKRVRLAPELADATRAAKVVREYVRTEARRKAKAEDTFDPAEFEDAPVVEDEFGRAPVPITAQLSGAAKRPRRAAAAGPSRAELGLEGASLSTFVRRHGGVRVPPGHEMHGEARRLVEFDRLRPLIRTTERARRGKLPAHLAELAAEAGYPVESGSEAQLLERLEEEARGGKIYPTRVANPRRGLRRAGKARYTSKGQTNAPGPRTRRQVARRNSKGQFVKKSKRGKRRKNPGEEVALVAVNPGRRRRRKHKHSSSGAHKGHRRKSNPHRKSGGAWRGIFSRFTPTQNEIAAGFGLVVSDFGANLVSSKFFKKDPDSLVAKFGEVLGSALVTKAIAAGMRMIPIGPIRNSAGIVASMAWPGGAFRGWKRIVIPALPEGKYKRTLAEWGLRGHVTLPTNGYVVDGVRGIAYGLDGCDVSAPRALPSVDGTYDEGDFDDVGDFDDDDGLEGAELQ